jgi:hypothetical protein
MAYAVPTALVQPLYVPAVADATVPVPGAGATLFVDSANDQLTVKAAAGSTLLNPWVHVAGTGSTNSISGPALKAVSLFSFTLTKECAALIRVHAMAVYATGGVKEVFDVTTGCVYNDATGVTWIGDGSPPGQAPAVLLTDTANAVVMQLQGVPGVATTWYYLVEYAFVAK